MDIANKRVMVSVGVIFFIVGAATIMFGQLAGGIPWLITLCAFLNFMAGAFACGLAYMGPRGDEDGSD